MHLALRYVVIVYHQYDVCENYVGSVYGGLSEGGVCVFRELCPVSFLVVGESPSVLLLSVVMSYINCCDVCCSVAFGTLVGVLVCWCLVLCGPSC